MVHKETHDTTARLPDQSVVAESRPDALCDATICEDVDGNVIRGDKDARRVFGCKREEAMGKNITTIFPSDRQGEDAMLLDDLKRGAAIEGLDTHRVARDGALRRMVLDIPPIPGERETVTSAAKFARPVVQADPSIEQLTLRAREAEHRAKNILAAVMATIRLSQAGSVEELKEVISGRIRALADVTSLTESRGQRQADLREVLNQEFWSTANEVKSRVKVDGPETMLSPDQAQGVAMIAHEMVTNSIKYGALSNADGQLRVEWTSHWNRIDLHWSESGLRNLIAPSVEGFGSRLIRSVTSQMLNGRCAFFWTPSGLMFKLSFDMAASTS